MCRSGAAGVMAKCHTRRGCPPNGRGGVSTLYRPRSSIKTPIRNATKAIPNSIISIKVMTPTVYLLILDTYAFSGPRMIVAAKGPEPPIEVDPGPFAYRLTRSSLTTASSKEPLHRLVVGLGAVLVEAVASHALGPCSHYSLVPGVGERGLSLAREVGAREIIYITLHPLAAIALAEGNYERASRLFEEGLTLSSVVRRGVQRRLLPGEARDDRRTRR